MADSYALNEKQFQSVVALPASDRYRHFVGRVELVWGLRDDAGWVSAADDGGHRAFPVWPHPDYAAACATGDWVGNAPESIEVHEFMDHWLPRMAEDGVLVAVFPTPKMQGTVVSAPQLQQEIQDELSRME